MGDHKERAKTYLETHGDALDQSSLHDAYGYVEVSDENVAALAEQFREVERDTALEWRRDPAHAECFSRLARLVKAADALRNRTQDLLAALEAAKDSVIAVTTFAAIHGFNYTGPSYGREIEAVEPALAAYDAETKGVDRG